MQTERAGPPEPYKLPFPQPSLEMAAVDFRPPPPPLEQLDGQLQALAEDLFKVAVDPDLWVDWLRRLAEAFECPTAHVAMYDFKRGVVMLHSVCSHGFGIPPDLMRDYEDSTPADERAGFAAAFPGRAIASHDLNPDKIAQIPVVQMAPPELGQMLLVNDLADPYWAFVSVLKHRDAARFTDLEKARLAALGVSFSRAMAVFRAWEARLRNDDRQAAVVESVEVPLMVFDAQGKSLSANAAALARLGLDALDRWTPPPEWDEAVAGALASGHAQLVCQGPTCLLPSRLSRLPGQTRSVLLELDVDPNSPTMRVDRFCAHYGLTHAERSVLELLAAGLDVEAIARARHSSRETVRAHLRSVRDKTGMASQHEILSAMGRFAPLSAVA